MNYGSLKLNIAIIIKTRPPEYPFFYRSRGSETQRPLHQWGILFFLI